MAEHARANGYQWTDAEVYVVWDLFHDSPERVGPSVFLTKELAIDWAIKQKGWEGRTVILKLPAIVAHRIAAEVGAVQP